MQRGMRSGVLGRKLSRDYCDNCNSDTTHGIVHRQMPTPERQGEVEMRNPKTLDVYRDENYNQQNNTVLFRVCVSLVRDWFLEVSGCFLR